MNRRPSTPPDPELWVRRMLIPAVIVFLALLSIMSSTPQTSMAQAVPTVPSPGQITGTVFDDRNGNDIQDAGEPGVANVTVTRSNGPATTTDSNGKYTFANVAPGSYTVNVTVPAGYVADGPTSHTVNVVSGGATEVNFTLLAQGVIQGVIFEDLNGNGRQDIGEPGVAGVTVNRTTGPGTTTDATGNYRFNNVTPGDYSVSIILPSGYVARESTSQKVHVASGGAGYASFALLTQGVIQGVVFDDRNANNTQDFGEPGVAGVTINRSDGSSTTTDSSGNYRFSNVTPGGYTISMILPPNYVAWGETSYEIYVGSGGSSLVNFSILAKGVIQGVVFEDANGNKSKDSGESGIAGVTITRNDGQSTVTDSSGSYRFSNVSPGSYTINLNLPAGYIAGTSISRDVILNSGGSAQANFSLIAQGVIQGIVFEDRNSNGVQDGNEPGIGGVTVSHGSGATQVTSSNGSYRFSDVAAGSYTVNVTVPTGYVAAGATSYPVNVGSGGSAQANFILLAQGIIRGVVYQDLNTNLTPDSDEPGIAGVVVTLDSGASTTTDGSGGYEFTNITPDSYVVNITLPAGYASGRATSRRVNVGSGNSAVVNFEVTVQGVIRGVVFDDRNGNDRQDIGELGLGGVVITRDDGATQTTSSNGSYRFDSVNPGNYTLTLTVPDGYVAGAETTRTVNVPSGGSAQANFILLAKGVIQGVVFEDRNGNELQDTNEPGVGGITITRADGSTTTTDGSGSYRFVDVNPGKYTVHMTVPDGYVAGGAASREVNLGSGGSGQANFALLARGVIQGVVFDDLNGNHTQDTGEPGVGGVTLTLDGGSPLTTDSSGGYRYESITPGDYRLAVAIPDGYVAGSYISLDINVGSGGSAQANFAVLAKGVIQGVVYEDRNDNGFQDGDEPGVGGVTITRNNRPPINTDGSGGYRFEGITPDVHAVTMTVPAGYVAAGPTSYSKNIGSGGSGQINFALLAQGVIQGVVFDDLNGNGLQDSGELGVGGVTITRDSGPPTVTNSNGSYQFNNIAPGSHTLEIAVPTGYSAATDTSISVNVSTDGSAQVSFALQAIGIIQGVVFDDINGNEVHDIGEPGIGGITITRGDASTTTASDGSYRFDSVAPGSYTLTIAVPEGYVAKGATSIPTEVTDESTEPVIFILQAQRQIRGVVFDDRNGNDAQDRGELGIAGVTIFLSNGASTTTDSSGGYQFNDVAPGNYLVRMTPPARYVVLRSNYESVNVNEDNIAQANFALQAQGIIQGVVFDDLNGNGRQEYGERGIGGIRVYGPGGWTTTWGDGSYRFYNVQSGTYYVSVSPPTNYAPSSLQDILVGVPNGGAGQANFGLNLRMRGIIKGIVFDDRNGNGTQDAREPGLGGTLAQLYPYNGYSVGPLLASRYSTGDGSFRFTGAGPNRLYAVFATPYSGFTSWYGGWGIHTNNYGNGTVVPKFPMIRLNTLAGYVFVDVNANHYFDSTERGLGGVIIELQTSSGTPVATARTTSDGRYQFVNVNRTGTYQAYRLVVRGGIGTNYNLLSASTQYVWVYADTPAYVNFVTQEKGTVVGSAVPGTQLIFTPVSAQAVAQGVSPQANFTVDVPSSGEYTLNDLPPGDYTVKQTPPEGFFAQSTSFNISLDEGESAQATFDAEPANSISGIVYEDINGSGTRDEGETPLSGVEIHLQQGNTTVHTTTTTAQGQYQFTGLTLGDYTVVEHDPSGYTSLTPNSVDLLLNAGNPVGFANFGDQLARSITGVVFRDDNFNGKRDSGEEAISQATVDLLPEKGNEPIATATTTLVTGEYRFDAVAIGSYRLRVTPLPDHNPSTPTLVSIVISDEEPSATVNFGQTTNDAEVLLPFIEK